jgi:hypothetical protein
MARLPSMFTPRETFAENPGFPTPVETRLKNMASQRDLIRPRILDILLDGGAASPLLSTTAEHYADVFADLFALYVAMQPGAFGEPILAGPAVKPMKAADRFVAFVANLFPGVTSGIAYAGLFDVDHSTYVERRDAMARAISSGTGLSAGG